MRIAVLGWSRRKVGGAESYIQTLTPELVRAGNTVSAWFETPGPADRPLIELPDGVDASVAEHEAQAGALVSGLKDWRPDVLFTHGFLSPAVENQLLDVAPAVAFAHGYYGSCISGSKTHKAPHPTPCARRFGPGCLIHYFPRRCGGLNPLTMVEQYRIQGSRLDTFQRYQSVVVASTHMKAEYAKHGIDADRLPILPYPTRPPENAPPVWTQVPVGDSVQLLFVGRMDLLKGGSLLISALPAVSRALGRHVELVFAGDGPEKEKWQTEALQVEAGSASVRIRFPGWLDRPAMEEVLQRSHLLVVPSLWPEPFGMVGLEAGWYGVPSAAFAVGGIPDWLQDGVNGFLAPGSPPTQDGIEGAIIRCLEDEARYLRLREGAWSAARNPRYSLSGHVEALQPVLARAAESSTDRGSRRPLAINQRGEP